MEINIELIPRYNHPSNVRPSNCGKFARGRRSRWIIGRIYRRSCARNSSARNDDRELGETPISWIREIVFLACRLNLQQLLSSLTDEGVAGVWHKNFERALLECASVPEYPSWEKWGKWWWIKSEFTHGFLLQDILKWI